MGGMDVFTEKIAVTLGDVDCLNRVKPSAFFGYFQHATTLHGDALGIGAGMIARAGQGWVLSRFSVEIERRPALSEELTLKTWPRGFKKLFAIRDYILTDSRGKTAAKARSGWLIIDIQKRRPLRGESLNVPLPCNDDIPDTLPDGAVSLPEHEGMTKAGFIIPAYSDTDYNGHVNNVRYVEWAQNYAYTAAGKDFLASESIRVDINYINEVLPGTPVDIYTRVEGGTALIDAKRQTDGMYVFRAGIKAR